jgi:flavin reductase (DIM6/NTAB) family NADH-FMN oxidoreductase RutF
MKPEGSMNEKTRPNDAIRELRHALGQFTTGVAIVTALGDDAGPVGMTINSFASVSLEPALVSWCIDRRAASYETFVNARHFGITVLAENQAPTNSAISRPAVTRRQSSPAAARGSNAKSSARSRWATTR